MLKKKNKNYLQSTKGVEDCRCKVGLQRPHTGIFESKQEMQVKCVLLTEDLQTQTERNVKRFNLNIVSDTKKRVCTSKAGSGVV